MANAAPSSPTPPPPPSRRPLDAHERLIIALASCALAALAVAIFTLPAPGDAVSSAAPAVALTSRESLADSAARADSTRALLARERADSLLEDSLRVAAIARARADSMQAAARMKKAKVVAPSAAKPVAAKPSPAKVEPVKPTRSRVSECEARVIAEVWSDAFAPCSADASRGVALAQRRVAAMYLSGRGTARDEAQATHWFSEAANGGDVESMYQFAVSLEKGRGIKKDQAGALRWYTRAGDGGNAAAQYALGQAYEKGRLTADKNKGVALEWYRKAAAQLYGDAQNKVRELTK